MLCLEPGGDGMLFLDGHYDGGPGLFECDLFAQDCPRLEKCMPWAIDGGGTWDGTRCSPIFARSGQAGESCTVEASTTYGIDNCGIGLMCWGVDPETLAGTCIPICTGSPGFPVCEDPDTTCMVGNAGAIALCLPTCQPLMQDCPSDEGCFAMGSDFVCVPDASGGNGGHGAPCEFVNACEPGQLCLSAAAHSACPAVGCCSSLCDLSAMEPDGGCVLHDAAQTCVPFYFEGRAPLGSEDVGICTVADDATSFEHVTALP